MFEGSIISESIVSLVKLFNNSWSIKVDTLSRQEFEFEVIYTGLVVFLDELTLSLLILTSLLDFMGIWLLFIKFDDF